MLSRTPAAERLLRTASELFSKEGIRGVGIDRIIAEAGVAKATLYQAFGSKEALVLAYLEQRDIGDRQAYRAQIAGLAGGPGAGAGRVLASFDLAARAAASSEYVGCVYANALSEFPDPDQAVAAAVRAHREWLRGQWVDALGGGDAAETLADGVQLLYDGALLGAKVARSSRPVLHAREVAAGWLSEFEARSVAANA